LAAPDAILELVERFSRNREQYLSPAYNETQVRREFLDPFFTALGWDVDNRAGYAQQYKDVVHEDAIKVGLDARAPDYSFRIGGVRKFFVEAKKPAVNLKDDPAPAFQLRRYAWSAKLPLSVLTDFQELAVYDCRVKPTVSDRPSVARTLYVPYEQYDGRWDEISEVFSKEAILQGSFDRYAESTKAKKGTAEVDKAFLSEIELWRDTLARNLALRNPALSQRELNYAVQVTIDRIIFLRICEDRSIEPYGRLQGLLNGGDTYGRLKALFWEADQRYNSGLFHFADEKGRAGYADRLTPGLTIDGKVLKEILKRLYYPESPYEFSVLPADILGQVYEQFLGKVIRLTAGHRAVVEDKPEVKKAGGVYYTPTYIVDYIVKHTVGRLLEGLTPKQAASLRILDPACGSGSFLIGAYQYLLDWHLAAYAERPEKHRKELVQGRGGEWQLATAEKKRILQASVYGVDIDAQAVETTKLSLLLKVLEGESSESLDAQLSFLHERALPDLAANIKCGNSLIGPDFYDDAQLGLAGLDEEERYRINVFDWEAEFPEFLGKAVPEERRGFDAVIGNPPYVNAWEMFASDPRSREYLGAPGRYHTAERHWDLYVLFVERGLQFVRPGGRLSYIIPFAFAIQKYGMGAREVLLTHHTLESVADLRTVRVFGDVPVITIVPVVVKRPPTAGAKIGVLRPRVGSSRRQVLGIDLSHEVPQAAMLAQHEHMLRLDLSELALGLCERLDRLSVPLGDLVHVNYGAQMSSKEKGAFGKDHVIRDSADSPTCKPMVSGRELYRYRLEWSGRYAEYGLADEMYGARWPEFFEQPKLMIRDITGTHRLETTVDSFGFYCDHTILCAHRAVDIASSKAMSTAAIDASARYTLPALQGLAASRLISAYYYFVLTGEGVRTGGGFHTYPTTVRRLPIFDVTCASGAQQRFLDRVGELSEGLLEKQRDLRDARNPHDLAQLTREVQALDRAIDLLVYQLYGLSDAEVELVESNT
jgi:type I restriction-modification system DNA methylase subunit